MRRARLIPLCFVLALSRRAIAQWQATGDVGAAYLRQSGIPESMVSTFGGTVEALGDHAWFRGSALAARAGEDRWTTQGVAVASFLSGMRRGMRVELSGAVSGFSETNASSAGSGEALARLHLGNPSLGVALGGGAGRVAASGSSGALYHAQGDVWRIVGVDRFIGTASFVNTHSAIAGTAAGRISYTDLSATWRRDRAFLSVGATAGFRAATNASAFGSADATLWVFPNAAIVAAVGRTLEDVTRGVPRTRYASLAIRLSARPQASIASRTPVVRGPTVVASREFIEVRVDSASSVEVMGDFTDWSPVALSREGRVWRLSRTLTPGPHRVALRIDGGEWTTPANLPRVTDDLGGTVAIVTVP